MRDPGTIFANINGGPFPSYTGKNATGAGATDGTEWIAAGIDDFMLGWSQNIMDKTGLTPSGVAESASASQIVEAMQLLLGPPGTICEWNLSVDPATIGARFLLLNGQGILRANYPDLDTNVCVGDGNNASVAAGGGAYYRADDAAGVTPNIAGVYLILPESRGYTTRGLDTAASVDPDGASRFLGDLQLDASQKITGILDNLVMTKGGTTTKTGVFTNSATSTGGGTGANATFTTVDFDSSLSTLPNTAKTNDIESRMINRSTKFAIRY